MLYAQMLKQIYKYCCGCINTATDQTSGSVLRPRKAEYTCAFKKM